MTGSDENGLSDNAALARMTQQANPASEGMPYEIFIAERAKIVEARQRAQQRTNQLITTGAAGALVLSITFLEKIAPTPTPATKPLLVAAWIGLLVSLGLNLIASYLSHHAFDAALKAFDTSFTERIPYSFKSPANFWTKILEAVSAVAFVFGIAFLASFALSNVNFTTRPDDVRTEGRASSAAAPAAAAASTGATPGAADSAVLPGPQDRDSVGTTSSAATAQ